jgi:hypothetical protein
MGELPQPVAWSARAFATRPDDLEQCIDPAAPAASTDALLRACLRDADGRAPGSAEVSGWSVALRLDALVAIRLAEGRGSERIELSCPHAGCAARFEAELDLEACRRPAQEAPVEFAGACGTPMLARAPNGLDHARWQRERTPLRSAAASLLLGTDGSGAGELDPATVEALDQALARRDPLRGLALELACPECGASARHRLNLEAHLLRSFARAQRRWLAEISLLARACAWHEADIAAMPAWRRAFYLDRLGEAAPEPA